MVINPCCCMPLQRGVRILAIIDIVVEGIQLAVYVLALITVIGYKIGIQNVTESTKTIGITALTINTILTLLALGLAIRLLVGANKRDIKQCRIWCFITCIVTAINTIVFIVNVSAGETEPADVTVMVLSVVYRMYIVWVVLAFIEEIKEQGDNTGFTQPGQVYSSDPRDGIIPVQPVVYAQTHVQYVHEVPKKSQY